MLARIPACDDVARRRGYFSFHLFTSSSGGVFLSWPHRDSRSGRCLDFGLARKSPVFATPAVGLLRLVPHLFDGSRRFLVRSDQVSVLARFSSAGKLNCKSSNLKRCLGNTGSNLQVHTSRPASIAGARGLTSREEPEPVVSAHRLCDHSRSLARVGPLASL